jgi:hypothetical protein
VLQLGLLAGRVSGGGTAWKLEVCQYRITRRETGTKWNGRGAVVDAVVDATTHHYRVPDLAGGATQHVTQLGNDYRTELGVDQVVEEQCLPTHPLDPNGSLGSRQLEKPRSWPTPRPPTTQQRLTVDPATGASPWASILLLPQDERAPWERTEGASEV